MNLTQLATFVRVAEMGSFSQAALALGTAQPALSRQVRLLETDLHATLLLRTGRGVVLTDAGRRLYEHGVAILQLAARAREDLAANRDEPTGRVAVGLPPSIGRMLTPPLVQHFRSDLPKARLAIIEGLSTHIVEWIASGRVDVGLVHNPSPNAAIEITPVLDEPLCLVSAATSPAGGRPRGAPKPLRFADLPAFALLVPEPSQAIRRLIDTQAALAGIKLQVAGEVSSVQSILDLVRLGHGHAVLARSAVQASGQPAAFRVRPIADSALTSTLCLALSAHKPATPLVRHASRLLRDLAVRALEAATPQGRERHADPGHARLR
jgi:LysR family transcriptional regulator, nitrogen assimilation regulatory protein